MKADPNDNGSTPEPTPKPKSDCPMHPNDPDCGCWVTG